MHCLSYTQYLVHNKSSSISQLIRGKSSDLQKLLRYLSGIVTSVFKGSASGHGGRSPPSGGTDGCGGLISVFSIIFLLHLNYLTF